MPLFSIDWAAFCFATAASWKTLQGGKSGDIRQRGENSVTSTIVGIQIEKGFDFSKLFCIRPSQDYFTSAWICDTITAQG